MRRGRLGAQSRGVRGDPSQRPLERQAAQRLQTLSVPPIHYTKSGDVNIAYQVLGDGPIDLVFVPGTTSNAELLWEEPHWAGFYRDLASFARLIVFDRRGVGLSDRVAGASLEERMDDVRAVMDAVGSERAALFGSLDGGAMLALFAATYPERSAALVLFAAQPRWTKAPGYPWGFDPEETQAWLRDAEERFADPTYMRDFIARLSPSIGHDEELLDWMGRAWRQSNSPGSLAAFRRMNIEIDVRDVLPAIQAPTLVLQRRDEQFVPAEVGRYVADRIPNAIYEELPGADFIPWFGDAASVVDSVREFVTGVWSERAWEREPDRVLATVLFTDVVDSSQTAVEVGDARWRELLEAHRRDVRTQLVRFRGRELDTAGDGFFATFDGPARAIRCARAIVAGAGELSIRAGLHTGECELIEDKVGGIAVHIGARVSGKASAGEVLVSGTVKDLVAGSRIGFDDRGLHELKGIPGEWRLYAVSDDPSTLPGASLN